MKPKSVKFVIEENDVTYYAWWTVCRDFTKSAILKRFLGKPYKNQLIIFRNGDAKWGTDLGAWYQYGETLLNNIVSGSFPLRELINDHLHYGKEVITVCREIEELDLKQAPSSRISALLKKVTGDYLKLNELGFVAVVSDLEHSALSNHLKSILEQRNIPAAKIQICLNTLMTDDRKNLAWEEMRNLLKLVIKYPDFRELKRSPDFTQHVSKYTWINFGYKGPAWTTKDFLARAEKIKKNANLKQTLKKHERFLNKIKTNRQKLENKLKLKMREKRAFETARAFSYLKTYRVDVRHYFCYISYRIIHELSRRYKLPITWFEFASEREIQSLLAGKNPNRQRVLSRSKFYAELWEGRKFLELSKPQLEKLLNKIVIQEQIAATDTLAGQAAFLGKARGKAKIILSPKDIGKVQKGDILVAVYTDPNLLPAMERAAAFVTEQGGITSHAAIVAREMKKPCIIGTKVATKVLKDDDLVEVDANKGVVKKIN